MGGDDSPGVSEGNRSGGYGERVQIIDRLPDAPWLPSGGVAEVVLAGPGDAFPGPVGLVRLLITEDDGRIFCVPRSGGRAGWDIPTAPVGHADADMTIGELTMAMFGTRQPVDLVGAVRNIVPAEVEYEWPSPVTYFCVYRPTMSPSPVVDGTWLSAEEAAVELAERHWWPLVPRSGHIRIEHFWALVDERVSELVAADDPWRAYEIAMEIAGLVFLEPWQTVVAFDGEFYVAWMELSDLFDAPWWNRRLTLEDADRILRDAGREWLATPVDTRHGLLVRWQERLGHLADELR